MTDAEAKWEEVKAEAEKVRGFFEGLPEEMRADAANLLIYEMVCWSCSDHYQALGILTETMLEFREASPSVLNEEEDEE